MSTPKKSITRKSRKTENTRFLTTKNVGCIYALSAAYAPNNYYIAFLFTAIGGKSNEKPLHTELDEAKSKMLNKDTLALGLKLGIRIETRDFFVVQGDSAQKHFVYFKENQRSTAGKDPFIVRINSFKPRAI